MPYRLAILVFFHLPEKKMKIELLKVDFSQIPKDKFGEEVKYGRELMINTALNIGPQGKVGKYLGNKMNCSNCHQEAAPNHFHLI